ncbi:MAG: hypothetical protein IKN09_04030, partial [Clostridia bacterium]|nr:hypothetical protein [Clostridia bacterium]
KDNINAGAATVIIMGKGNYTGTRNVTFKIDQLNVSKLTIGTIANQTYTGKEIKPVVSVKNGNTVLKLNTDYTVSYKNNINAGTATATIKGKGNYTGTANKTFKIFKDISKCTIQDIPVQKLTIDELKANLLGDKSVKSKVVLVEGNVQPSIVIKDGKRTLKLGKDYTVSYKNCNKIGTGTATIKGIGVYAGTVKKNFKIKGINISEGQFLDIEKQVYNGKVQKPYLRSSIGNLLEEGITHKISYGKNINVGTGTITIQGIGFFEGTVTQTFKIVAKNISKCNINDIQSQKYTGKEVKPKVTVKDGSTVLKEGTDYTVSFKNNKKVGNATVTVTGKGNYNGSNSTTFQIIKK